MILSFFTSPKTDAPRAEDLVYDCDDLLDECDDCDLVIDEAEEEEELAVEAAE